MSARKSWPAGDTGRAPGRPQHRPQRPAGPAGDSSFATTGDSMADVTNASGDLWEGALLTPMRYAPAVGQDDHLASYRHRTQTLIDTSTGETLALSMNRAFRQADADGLVPGAPVSAERIRRKSQAMIGALGRARDAIEDMDG